MPSHTGLFRAAAMAIHKAIRINMFTKGIKMSKAHQIGLLATLHIRKKLTMGIQAIQAFYVCVLDAIVCRQYARYAYMIRINITSPPANPGIFPSFHLTAL